MQAKKLKFNRRFLVWALLVCGVIFACARGTYAQSPVTFMQRAFIVLPTHVESTEWKNPEAVLVQDQNEDALYQEFRAHGSAYLPLPKGTSETPTQIPEAAAASTGTATETPSAPISPESDTSSTPDMGTETPDAQPAEESAPQEDPQPASGAAPADTSTSMGDTHTLATFFSRVTGLVPLALETLVAPSGDSSTEAVPEEVAPVETSTESGNLTNEPAVEPTVEAPVDAGTETPSVPETEDAGADASSSIEIAPESQATGTPEAPHPFCEGEEGCESHALTVDGFSIPSLDANENLENVQIRLSLAGKPVTNEFAQGVTIDYSFGGEWQNAGAIPLDEEVSNALNGGYFLFALPDIASAQEIEKMRVRLTFYGKTGDMEQVYVDSIWLEFHAQVIDESTLEARAEGEAQALKRPQLHDLLSPQTDFPQTELPRFTLKYHEQRNFIVQFFRHIFASRIADVAHVSLIHAGVEDTGIVPKIDMTTDGLWTIRIDDADRERLKPGKYTIRLDINEGSVSYSDSFEFLWGLLAVNPEKTQYRVGEGAHFAFASLSDNGNTVCDADLHSYVIQPDGMVKELPVLPSGACKGNNIVDVPDYTAVYDTTQVGTHSIYVERIDQNGNVVAHTEDTFEVASDTPISIERSGPTRIYPVSTYPITLTVDSEDAFSGVLTEIVPDNFVVSNTDATITTEDGVQHLTWPITLRANEGKSFSYTIDAPDISPFLYQLGPAHVEVDDSTFVLGDHPEAMVPIASSSVPNVPDSTADGTLERVGSPSSTDETSGKPAIPDSSAATEASADTNTPAPMDTEATDTEQIPTETPATSPDETSIPPQSTDTPAATENPAEEVPQAETPSSPSGDQSPDPQPLLLGETIVDASSTDIETLTSDASSSDASGTTSEAVVSTSAKISKHSFTEFRKWQIASDATGNMIAYWTGATIPSGWSCISCTATQTMYQKFARGSTTYSGATSYGSATSTHTADGTVYTSATVNSESGGATDIAVASHTHTLTPTVAATAVLPRYRQLRIIQFNSAGEPASLPAGIVLMFDGAVPTGWTRYSAEDGFYPYGENTVGTTGGSNTHTHAVTGTTASASGSTVQSRNGGTQVTAATAAHTHTISTTTNAANNEPPYIEVVMATTSSATSTPIGAITMWTNTPPDSWTNNSSVSGDPFFERFAKASTTYGTTGGSATHIHDDILSIITSAAIGTIGGRSGTTGSASTHTHLADVTNFSQSSNLPPYVDVIFAKRLAAVPTYTQSAYKWFVNNGTTPPTDVWPVGSTDLGQNEPISATSTPVAYDGVVRLRLAVANNIATSSGATFKLQFASTTASCAAVATWTDVGSTTSSAEWRGYDNSTTTDGAALSSSTLSVTEKKETYEEQNPSATAPNDIGPGQDGEWDWVLQHHSPYGGATYCFRMVESAGSVFYAYSIYPQLYTNASPTVTLSKPFDNEVVATSTPTFQFTGSDAESNTVNYQIQVDNDHDFSSTAVDLSSESSPLFNNLTEPSNKAPFNNGQTISVQPTTALTNGTIYYWRVRSKDSGSASWGNWSTVNSFQASTSAQATAWFQTTTYQFNSNTNIGIDTSTDHMTFASGSTTATSTSQALNFTDASAGNAWGLLSWNDTEPPGDIKYKIQYQSGGTWADIPDSALSGNSAGFDTSPVNLLGLSPSTYGTIRVVAVLTNPGGSPVLSDWTLSWGYRIDTPTIVSLFANEKTATVTPSFRFYTNDPQHDDLIYEFSWSTSSAFITSTTRLSSTTSEFANFTTATDTSPFNSGSTIQYTIPGSLALTNGATYWWRVRAVDPFGSNAFSAYSDVQSFTVDTSVVASTWFQTTADQFDLDTLSGVVSAFGDIATVATTADESMLVYGEGNSATPKYRQWDGSTWTSQSSMNDVGVVPAWVVTRAAPTREEYLSATMGSDGDVNAQVFSNGVWGNAVELTTAAPDADMRAFDIAYETSSGRAIVAYCDGDADPSYQIWNGTSWSAAATINLASTNNCGWIKLISNPTSNEIIVISNDTSGSQYEAQVWNGSAWGNSTTLGSMTEPRHEGIAAQYEESGNQAVVAVSNGNFNRFTWTAWNGTAWSAAATQGLGNDFEWGSLARDQGSDNMALCYVDEDQDIGIVRWTGAAWAGQTELDTDGTSKDSREFDCAFETGGSRDGDIMVAYSNTTGVQYNYWNGTVWSGGAALASLGASPIVEMRRGGDGKIEVLSLTSASDRYDYSYWNGTSWSAFQTLEADAGVNAAPYKEPFMMASRNAGSSGSIRGAPVAVFTSGSGPYWQQFTATSTASGGSSILYQIEYYNTASSSWTLVPDSLIPGNSTGTTSKTVDLSAVLPVSTYAQLRPVANMTCNGGTCPTLSDWTITWAAGITISGTAQQYDQSTNLTSGTVAVALNGVIQTGKTGTISGGSWSIANVNATAGDVITVFIQGAGATGRAVGVTKYDGTGNVTGINLYERHLTVGSDDLSTTTNTDIGLYDNTNSSDIFANVDGGNDLTVCVVAGCEDAELYIKTGNTYQPGSGADVSTRNIEINGTFLPNGNTIRVAGSWDNNGISTMATSSLIFTATSTSETFDDTGATSPVIYNNVTFGETSGSATWILANSLDIDGSLGVTFGTLARGVNSLTVAGNLTNGASGLWTGTGTTTFDGTAAAAWTDSAGTKQNIGRVVIDGTSKTVNLGSNVKAQSITIGADDILDAISTFSIDDAGPWTNNNAFVARTGTVSFSGTVTNQVINTGGSSFYNLTFSGANGTWSFTQPTLSVGNNFTVSTGTVTMPTGTTTVTGSWDSTGGTFAHNNGGVTFNSSGAKTITLAGGNFTNTFYKLAFTGSGSWSFVGANATTSDDLIVTSGTVTFPTGVLALGGSLIKSGGTITANSGTLQLTAATAKTIQTGGSSLFSILETGSGSWSFIDTNVAAQGNVTISAGTMTLPSGTFTIGRSFTNTATFNNNSGTVSLNATTTGNTISPGNSSFYNLTFNSAAGGWTIAQNATTTMAFALIDASAFTLNPGSYLSVGGSFTNSVGGASTTWAGSNLALVSSTTVAMNAKTNAGDTYGTLIVGSTTKASVWNSSAATYTIHAGGYLYSQDHNAVDGALNIYGAYTRTIGTEYWSYDTDFDGASLGTSSARQANIRFSSGSSATITGATLNVSGTVTSTTTVDALSGAYTVSVVSGTTTASYYSFAGLGSTGLTLATSTVVTSLSDGSFTPAVASGSGITVASSTIDRNPALQIFRVTFATTTAINAFNVTQTGGAPASYWWFRDTSGNLQGEAHDSDTGDPGSIRWDDSNLLITISGNVYSDEVNTPLGAPTCDGSTQNVKIVVNGGTSYTGSCNAGTGAYSISNVAIAGSPIITVFLNTNGGVRATTITKTPTANIANLNLIQNRIITRHEDATPLTIADMATYDETFDNDIRFDAATGTSNTLTVRPNTELHIASSTSFAPGGTVTLQSGSTGNSWDGTLHVDNSGTFTGAGTTTYSIGGRLQVDSGATLTSASSTFDFTATSSGKNITTPNPQTVTFYNLKFSGANGGWSIDGNIQVDGALDVNAGTVSGTNNITVTNGSMGGNGTVAMTGGTTLIGHTNIFGGTTPWTFFNLTFGDGTTIGSTVPAGGATTTVSRVLTISAGHTLSAGTSQWNLSGGGTPLVITGTLSYATSTIRYSNGGATNVTAAQYYNLDLNAASGTPTYTAQSGAIQVHGNLTVGGTSNTTFDVNTNDPALPVDGSVLIASNGTLSASNSGTFTVAGSWSNNGTFTGNGGTVSFIGSGSPTIAAGNSPFSSLTINGTGAFTVSQDATTTSAFTLTSAGSFTLASGKALAVGGVFTNGVGGAATTWTNTLLTLSSGTNYQINASTTNEVYGTLIVAANTHIRMWNSSAGSVSVNPSGSLYSQDNGNIDGALYIYGNYAKSSGTDYWSYATDFDGTTLSSPRAVTVSFAANATATISGGTLNMVGAAGATTTVTNQGSGTYALVVNAGTFNAQYYALRNMNANGLVLTSAPTITTLSNGDIEVGITGGSGMTVGGTVITQNPAKNFTSNRFATSSGVSSAQNVTATGTTVSAWRFTNHYGNIAGEAFDNDPAGDPGYIVWDNSAAQITISGTVYSDEGSTPIGASVCDGSSQRVHLRVAGLTDYTTSCSVASSTFSIANVAYSAGDVLTLYLDTNGGAKAANVTMEPQTSISGMDLYQNRVIVRHESTNPMTIEKMSVWDSVGDTDIPFTAVDASPDTLTFPSNTKLIVWNSKTFAPGGNVTLSGGGGGASYDGTLELYPNAVFTAAGTESHTIGGSLITGGGASITGAQATFTFTSNAAARTVDTNDGSIYNMTFNGTGSFNMTDTNISLGNNFTITQGSVTLPSGTTTVAGSFQNTGGSFTQSSGTLYFTATASGKSIAVGTSSIYYAHFNGSGGSWTFTSANATSTTGFLVDAGSVTLPSGTLTVGGPFDIEGGSFTHNSGTVKLTGSAASTTLKGNGSTFNSTTIASSGSYVMRDANPTLVGSLTISSGALTLATGTLSIGGSFIATGGTFAHSSGTVLFNAAGTGRTINPGVSSFNNVSLASASGGWTIAANATTTGNFSLSSASSFTMATATRLAVYGIFTNMVGGSATTWTGSTLDIETGTSYTVNTSAAGDDYYNNVVIGPSTNLRMWNSAATSTSIATSSSLYSQDHNKIDGSLYIFGNYTRSSGADYWSYATDFDGTALGGSSRAVTVAFAPNATATFSGATLQMIGSAGATTTVTNQGSGTYTLVVDSGTINASYYALRNAGSHGLQLTGIDTVTSLSNGDYQLAVSGGSLLSVSSSTVNANAALAVTGMRFATTTAITGANVELSGTTPNFWNFSSYTGNLSGEAFDIDGADACGSIRWSNSSCLITEQTHYRWRNDDGGESVPNTEWYNQSWTKRQRVAITNADASGYANAVVKLTVPYDSDMQADFDDLRFTDSTGLTLLSYWKESYTASTNATIWVKVPTLATSTVTNVYMYYGNSGVADGGTGTSTFSGFDDFEDGNLSEYTGNTALFTTDTNNVYERNRRLISADVTNKTTDGMINTTSATTSQGSTIRYFEYVDTSASSDEGCTLFNTLAPATGHSNYAVCLEQFLGNRVSIVKNVSNNETSGTLLATTSITYSTGWYEVEVRWSTSNLISVSVSRNGSVVATTSATGDLARTSGGIGFAYWTMHGGWDAYTVRPLLTTEPSYVFSVEQVPGGASWYAAQDTSASGIIAGTTKRLRFVVENSGLTVTNQQYRLDYAPKGNAPSCESVAYNTYAQVPALASCGTSPICMASSTQFSNQASTTDLVTGDGTFTYGQILQNTSNKTANLSLGSDTFTEVEYAITPTNNATGTAYCLRVTNNGTDLDSYAKVAELGLLFNPRVLSWSLNDGQDITLTPGTTTLVYATGTVSDANGFADIQYATSTIYRSGVGQSCTANQNNCYQIATSSCTLSGCSGNSCNVSCVAPINYFADPTDSGTHSAEDWRADILVSDLENGHDTQSTIGSELLTMRALDVTNAIAYAPAAVNSDTGATDATTTVQNIGNDVLNVNISGTDLTSGASTIPVGNQKFATSTFTYSSCTICNALTSTGTSYTINLAKPTTTTPGMTTDIYWGIGIPFGTAATAHQGTNTFIAI